MKPPVTDSGVRATEGGSGRNRARSPQPLSKQALVHELQVHQVELEQQNEELRAAERDLASAHDRYVDLFDFAPVGYLTLDRDGRITDANLTATAELGVDRHALLGSQFQRFVVLADSDRWQRLKALAWRRGGSRRIELRLRCQDGRQFHAQVDCLRVLRPGAETQLRVTIADVSQRKLAETNRRIAISGSLARESERRRVAHGLHEDLGQRLSALKMLLDELSHPAGQAQRRATAASMASQIDEALAVVRRMSADLHPLILDNLGLTAALEWLVSDVAVRLGLAVELHLDEDVRLGEASAIAIYRLAEAVLEHLAEHVSGGVSLELLRRPRDIVLQVQWEPGHTRPGALAANAMDMSERLNDQVHLLAGRLELDELAEGTGRISIFLPVSRSGDR